MPGLPALFDLSGRVAVVTGGGGALGRVVAGALAGAGASVAVVDLSEDTAAKVAASLTEAGAGAQAGADTSAVKAIGLGADLSTEDGVEGAFAAVDRAFGRVDILVNSISAAIDRHDPEEFPLPTWEAMLASNLTSYFLCSRAAAQRMIPAGRGGSIVNFGSIAGSSVLGRGGLAYGVAKGGVAQLTKETAYAWAPHRIRVNAVLPCQFVNDWWRGNLADPERRVLVDRVVSAIPLGRMGDPEEIAGPVLFLASEAASMVTGVLLPVDGGNLAMNPGASLSW
ncbi:MAG TPA: SDR family oxidoreductase [Streptosporangiaceae bacterium]|nr:SDR family oxidoreductase [Streptosporangiaceae bacterium]